jgi:aspartate racemase
MVGKTRIIGIVGGIGPHAGIDLNRKIFDQTRASCDQEHLNVILLSLSGEIPDRSAYLLGRSAENPVTGILKCLQILETAGAEVAGIACNTAHAPLIFDGILDSLRLSGGRIELVNMIEAVGEFLRVNWPDVRNVGVLGTDGTVESDAYASVLRSCGMTVVYPDAVIQRDKVHGAIYHPAYGIKAVSEPVTRQARDALRGAAEHLIQDKKCDALVLGCTEIPLALREKEMLGKPLIDPTVVLARALIARVAPERLVTVSAVTGKTGDRRSEKC